LPELGAVDAGAGSTCSSMKRFSAVSTSSPWTVVRLVMVSPADSNSIEKGEHVAQRAPVRVGCVPSSSKGSW
jgi:hypothetical protein